MLSHFQVHNGINRAGARVSFEKIRTRAAHPSGRQVARSPAAAGQSTDLVLGEIWNEPPPHKAACACDEESHGKNYGAGSNTKR